MPASALADNPKPTKLHVTSSAFGNNQPIPAEYTCEGGDNVPPLAWSKVPGATQSIAILVDDPEATKGTFTHWLVTAIPSTTTSISGALPEGATPGRNDKGAMGYAGPCPPSGMHHYHFRVYALDVAIPKVATRAELLDAVRGHTLATGELVGTYRKSH